MADFHVTEPPDLAKPLLERLILGATEESFRLIVETIPGLIAVMTPEGRVEHVNGQVLEYFGRTLSELKQRGDDRRGAPGRPARRDRRLAARR